MAKAEKLFPFILQWEGGFVNDPIDTGGATNMGITLNTYIVYCKKKGMRKPCIEDLRNIGKQQVYDIFKQLYWDRWRGDEIENQKIANILVDWVWLSGSNGIIRPQQIVGVKADGLVGIKTIEAVNKQDADILFSNIYNARVAFMNNIVRSSIDIYEKRIKRKATEKEILRNTKKKYLNGWLNRLNALKKI